MTQQIKAVLTQSDNLRAKTVAIGAAQSLLDLTDVDATSIGDGAVCANDRRDLRSRDPLPHLPPRCERSGGADGLAGGPA